MFKKILFFLLSINILNGIKNPVLASENLTSKEKFQGNIPLFTLQSCQKTISNKDTSFAKVKTPYYERCEYNPLFFANEEQMELYLANLKQAFDAGDYDPILKRNSFQNPFHFNFGENKKNLPEIEYFFVSMNILKSDCHRFLSYREVSLSNKIRHLMEAKRLLKQGLCKNFISEERLKINYRNLDYIQKSTYIIELISTINWEISDIYSYYKHYDNLSGRKKNARILREIISNNTLSFKYLNAVSESEKNKSWLDAYNKNLFSYYHANWFLSKLDCILSEQRKVYSQNALKIKEIFKENGSKEYATLCQELENNQEKLYRFRNQHQIRSPEVFARRKFEEIDARKKLNLIFKESIHIWKSNLLTLSNAIEMLLGEIEALNASHIVILRESDGVGSANNDQLIKIRDQVIYNYQILLNNIKLNIKASGDDDIKSLYIIENFVETSRLLDMLKAVAMIHICSNNFQEAGKIVDIIFKMDDLFDISNNNEIKGLIAVIKNLNGDPSYLLELIKEQEAAEAAAEKKRPLKARKARKRNRRLRKKNSNRSFQENKKSIGQNNRQITPAVDMQPAVPVNQGAVEFIGSVKSRAEEKQEKQQRHLESEQRKKEKNESKQELESKNEPDDHVKPEKVKKSLSKKQQVIEFLKKHPQRTIETEFPNLPTAAKKTYEEIKNKTWQINREQLLNLFKSLGCKKEVVKGNHKRLSLPDFDKITLADGTLVTLLESEDNRTSSRKKPTKKRAQNNQNTFGTGSVVFPKWEYRKTVPHYLRHQILIALDKILANKILSNQEKEPLQKNESPR